MWLPLSIRVTDVSVIWECVPNPSHSPAKGASCCELILCSSLPLVDQFSHASPAGEFVEGDEQHRVYFTSWEENKARLG
ncbi:hypothetical protein E2C01_060923 [Portunus trituberculatus]|uniref:Uncharacterized protein n=1 Tax=Portunus trituberculatus TaxID=210409 RepID=A0A5B7H3W5_PORTR|nr:hypothetical protein [Portunus trituberculatus]